MVERTTNCRGGQVSRIIHAADLFCGAGGTSSGLYRAIDRAGDRLDLVAINHWTIAIDTHRANHPDARHICAPLEGLDPRKAVPSGWLDILVASPECTHHSIARGGRPVCDQLRASAWHILRWAELLKIDNILIENVREFQDWGPTDAAGKPIKSKKGDMYRAFLSALRSLNYNVEDRVLNAADYGDPTSRCRLFIMARRGGRAINWPVASHGIGIKQAYRTAREIIDWDLPGISIFNRRKPLADRTIARIAAGIRKYGGENAQPFLTMLYGTNDVRSVDRPCPTITAGGQHIGLVQPFLIKYHGDHVGKNDGAERNCSLDLPIPTLDTSNRYGLVEPFIVPIDHASNGASGARSVDEPLGTITAENRFAICQPFVLQQQSCGAPRTVDEPLPTIATAGAIALVEPFITIMKGQSKTSSSIDEPVPTLTTNAHLYLCEPFLTQYNGKSKNQSVNEPLNTITTKERFALVEPSSSECGVLDIRFRMLQPHELAAAMSFDSGYKFEGNKTETIKQIGNAVPVCTAEALCRSLLNC
jgi:DNA (cytosine-5)-methyltransferase 1